MKFRRTKIFVILFKLFEDDMQSSSKAHAFSLLYDLKKQGKMFFPFLHSKFRSFVVSKDTVSCCILYIFKRFK